MSFILFFGTYSMTVSLKKFKFSRYFPTTLRSFLSDFSIIISILVFCGLDHLMELDTPKLHVPTEIKLRKLISDFSIFMSIMSFVGLDMLMGLDTPKLIVPTEFKFPLCSSPSSFHGPADQRRHQRLWLPPGPVLGGGPDGRVLLPGSPWYVAATVISIAHIDSLKMESESSAPGEQPQFLGVREQRLTGILVFVLTGVSIFLAPVLQVIHPMPVLYGVFLYMGVASLSGIQFWERIKLYMMPPNTSRTSPSCATSPLHSGSDHLPRRALDPQVHLPRHHLPVMILGLLLVRKLLDLMFSQHDLAWMDDLLPDKDKKKDDDKKKKKKKKKKMRLRHILGEDDNTPTPTLFTEMDTLQIEGGELEWKESARWVKFERRWRRRGRGSKPHVSTLTLHSLFELRTCLQTGSILLDLEGYSLPQIVDEIVERQISDGLISPDLREKISFVLLRKHRHQTKKPIHRSLADIGKSSNAASTAEHHVIPPHISTSLPPSSSLLPPSFLPPPSFLQLKNKFMKKIPRDAEASNVLVGEVDFLDKPFVSFVRLAQATTLGGLTEVPVPTRFLFILLGPHGKTKAYNEIGRAIATLMTDDLFSDVAYKARDREDLIAGVDEFLDEVIVLPPGEWDPKIRIEPPKKEVGAEPERAGGQPLIILSSTGPILIFEKLLYEFSKSNGIDYMELRLWIGLHSCLQCFLLEPGSIIQSTEASNPTSSPPISFNMTDMDWSQLSKKECVKYGGVLVGNSCKYVPDLALMSFILFFGTYSMTVSLKKFKFSRYFPTTLRSFLSDFSIIISILVFCGLDHLMELDTPKLHLRKLISDFSIFMSIMSFVGLDMLMGLDTPKLIVPTEFKKGCGYHLDLFWVGVLMAVCSFLGLPWYVAATVISIAHIDSLKMESESSAPESSRSSWGIYPVLCVCREQRLTGILVFVLTGVSIFLAPVLQYIPMPVLYGVFLYMGVASLSGIQRIKLYMMPPKHQPDFSFLRHVPLRRVHLFTLVQIICLAVLWILKSTFLAIIFPVMVRPFIQLEYILHLLRLGGMLDGDAAGIQCLKKTAEDACLKNQNVHLVY
ncbi:hypothetical protein F7725_015037 [Dissostichus mawsoni]|uniref:Anion exchange protein n=1 Tax=Dissostichus mawsoni TaxID=36200 RepID=A0A7J5YGM6_DISMA|nr:hypothetical protein F7725_015037 [Dissostichus mawsoni]